MMQTAHTGTTDSALEQTPETDGSVLVTLAVAAAVPAAMVAFVFPIAVASVLLGALVGLAAG